jgi:hypothetical protein
MADAADSKSVGRKAVWVRLPPPALSYLKCSMCRGSRLIKGDLNEGPCNSHALFSMGGLVRRNHLRVVESVPMQEALWR